MPEELAARMDALIAEEPTIERRPAAYRRVTRSAILIELTRRFLSVLEQEHAERKDERAA
jgi:hypothetical protein